jgi:signal transduction histidine kinase
VIFAAYAMLGGALSLAGWIAGIPRLTDWWLTGITIKANTALCLMSTGSAVLLLQLLPAGRSLALALGLLPGAIGVATLLQHVFEIDFGIDTLLVDEPPGASATASPGRMGPPAASSFALLSVALWLVVRAPRHVLSIALPLIVLGISMVSMIGYAYGAATMYTVPRLTGIAIQTATMFAALTASLICAQPGRQPWLTIIENSTAGQLARLLLPLTIATPVLLGWLRISGERAGLYDVAFGTALRTSLEIALLVCALWWMIRLARTRDQQQREADQRKDQFLATLAHELRNPLAPIRMAATLARQPQVSQAQRQWCNDVIERQVRHMSLLLDDLLDISRITRGALELRRVPTSLSALMDSALETARPLLDSRQHTLAVDLPVDATVDVDPLRLAQVVSNLLNNAAKYTEPGGHIRVSASLHGNDLQIEVRDNGIGIAPDDQEAIFRMFAQIPSARQHSGGGLGIGLALTRALVELHGGRLVARSDGAGRGSTFTLYLPGVVAGAAGNLPLPAAQHIAERQSAGQPPASS